MYLECPICGHILYFCNTFDYVKEKELPGGVCVGPVAYHMSCPEKAIKYINSKQNRPKDEHEAIVMIKKE